MREGNEALEPSVSTDMSDTTHTQDLGDDSPTIPPVTGATSTVEVVDGEPSSLEDTGEMDALAADDTLEVPSAVEAAPFDYDRYYGPDPEWPPPAEPVDAPPVVKPKKNRDGVLFFVGALAAAFLGAAMTVGLLAATGSLGTGESPTTTAAAIVQEAVTPTDTQAPAIQNTIVNELGAAVNPTAVALKAIPSIVTVTTADSAGTGVGSGSGVVISTDGYIATNEHVVDGASAYTVTFEDGRIYTAELIGADPLTDLAVLKIDGENLVPIDFGSADELSLGDPAVAVGNPLGQQGGSSISVGIISAFDRRVDFSDGSELFGMIQTDAAINSGSSGGALVNAEGELIGITSAIGVSNAGPEGIGYAIPVELVERITSEIIEAGDVAHPFLGVTIATFEETLDDGAIQPTGAEVISIEGTDSAAGAAGLEVGDVIVQIGDRPISSQNDLILAVRLYRVSDTVEFTALRDSAEETFQVTMGRRPIEFGG